MSSSCRQPHTAMPAVGCAAIMATIVLGDIAEPTSGLASERAAASVEVAADVDAAPSSPRSPVEGPSAVTAIAGDTRHGTADTSPMPAAALQSGDREARTPPGVPHEGSAATDGNGAPAIGTTEPGDCTLPSSSSMPTLEGGDLSMLSQSRRLSDKRHVGHSATPSSSCHRGTPCRRNTGDGRKSACRGLTGTCNKGT